MMKAIVVSSVTVALLLAASATGGAQVPGEVRVDVTSRVDGTPIAGARVADIMGESRGLTGPDGSLTLRGLTPGAHRLRVTALGFRSRYAEATVANGQRTTIDVALDTAHVVPKTLSPVAVVARKDTSRDDAIVISRTQIEASGAQDLPAVLEQQTGSGVVVTREGGPGSPATVSIRGSNANEVLVLVDGQRMDSPLTGETDLSLIPLSNVEQITIVRGAQAARYGPGALAGAILIQSRHPVGSTVAADASAGSWGARAGALSVGLTAPGIGAGQITADRQATVGDFTYNVPGVRGGGVAVRQNDASMQSAFAGNFSGTAAGVDLTSRLAYAETSRGLPGPAAAPDPTGHEDDGRLSGGISVAMTQGAVRWMADVAADHERAHYLTRDTSLGPTYEDRVTANSVNMSLSGTIGGPAFSVSAGTEARWLQVAATELNDSAPSAENDEGVWVQLRAVQPIGNVFIATVTANGRVDQNSLISGVVFSPSATLTLSRGALFASLTGGQSYSPPSLADQYFHEGVLVRPNPDLQPERTRDEVEARVGTRDVALGHDAKSPQWSGELGVFQANVDGMILWSPNFRFVWSPSNANVHRYGWDGNTSLDLPAIGVTLHGAVSDVAVEYAGPVLSGQIPYRPRVSAEAAESFTRGRFHLEVASLYIGDRRTEQGTPLNALGGYWVSNAHLTVRLLTGGWPIDGVLGVDNALDRHVALLYDYPLPGRTWSVGLRLRRTSGRAG